MTDHSTDLILLPRDVVERAERALIQAYRKALVVAPVLRVPYPNTKPTQSPWSKYVEPMAREAFDARRALGLAMAEFKGSIHEH